MNIKSNAIALMVSAILVSNVSAQRRAVEEAIPVLPREMGLFIDSMQTGSSSISVSVANGIKRIDAVENGLKARIEEDTEYGSITMTITRTYGPDDLEDLMHTQPELYMHLKAMPTEVGDSTFEISVGVTKKYEADDAEDLEERFPEAHEVYKKFSDPKAAQIPQLRINPRMIRPAAPVRPAIPVEIDPDGVRVHEDEEGDDKKEDDKTEKESADKKDDGSKR